MDVWSGHHLLGPFRYGTIQKKERRNKIKIIKIHESAPKGLVSMRHANFTIKKKIYKKRSPLNLYTLNFSLTESFPHKSSLSWKTPWIFEATADHYPEASLKLLLFSAYMALSLFFSGSLSSCEAYPPHPCSWVLSAAKSQKHNHTSVPSVPSLLKA